VGGGTREIPASKLAALARLYAVPVERFMEPAPTAFEAIDEWLNATVIAASALSARIGRGRRKLAKGLETSPPLGSVNAQHELKEDRLEDPGICDGLRALAHRSTPLDRRPPGRPAPGGGLSPGGEQR
jgi:hypothetical protein